MITPPHGSQLNPIDLTDDCFPDPAKHWSKLFEQQLSGERTNDNILNGASSSASINGNADVALQKKFRINSRSVFLTYPQCSLDKQILLNFLASLKHEASYIIVCHEKHKDGSPHLHAVVKFQNKVDIKKETYFDINGFHPNIQTTKNINASIQYCKKDGDYIEEGSHSNDHVNKIATMLPEFYEVDKFLESLLLGYE